MAGVLLVSTLLPLSLSAKEITLLPQELPPTPLSRWQTMVGDVLVIDTKDNIGYLVHPEGRYTSFPVATGQRRVVRYIGRIYNATTPTGNWTVLSKETKGDRITFGPLGTFFRLFDDEDTEQTPYGIHSHAYVDNMLSRAERYRSMGCIIVSDEILAAIEVTYEINNDALPVVTVYGLDQDIVTFVSQIKATSVREQKDL